MTSKKLLTEVSATAVDPICGMKLSTEKAAGTQKYNGQTYYFCGQSCTKRFQADPASFVTPRLGSTLQSADVAKSICPMHPEVSQKGPGNCPKCGMALEPVTPSAPAKHSD